ncbi:MAG: PAS domain S-box protein [Terracidiphilus sp.]
MQAIVDSSDDAIYSKSLDGTILSWNRAAELIYGYTASEAIGQPMLLVVPPERHREAQDFLQQIRQGDRVKHFETVRERKDGSRIDVSVTLSPVMDAQGKITACSVITRDITVRKDAEKHLVQMEGRYRGLLEAAPDGMVVVNQGGRIVLLNAQAERQFRYCRDELLGQKVTNIIPEGFAERLIADGARSAAEALAQQIGAGIELNGRRKDGTEFPIEIMLSPLESSEGILVTAAIRDITVRKEAEREILALNRDLERRVELRTAELSYAMRGLSESVKELESFSYSVSHDLRAPLRHMDGFLTLLYKRSYSTLDDSAKHYVDCALQASKRMGCLIDDLLKFSRLGRSELRKTQVDLNLLVDQIRKELEPEARDRQVVWKLGVLPHLPADEGMLRQVLENLIGNALKFTRQRPVAEIEIGSEPRPNGEVVIFVRDNGAGFDAQYCPKLFQIFQRLHSEQEFEGTGIGLAIARRVVERHGGRIWAEGIVGKGAAFHFSLPS